ncbi:hypothetical protein ABK040_010753 [Willaertia magna]
MLANNKQTATGTGTATTTGTTGASTYLKAIGWLLMTIASLIFGIYSLRIYNYNIHKIESTKNVGEGFFDIWFKPYHTSSLLKYICFLLHVIPGGIVFLLSPLQFLQKFRTNFLTLHKWIGRIIFINVIISVISSFCLLLTSKMGMGACLSTLIFGPYTLFCLYKAYVTIVKDKNYNAHREWCIRMWALCFGVFYMRILIGLVKDLFYEKEAWLNEEIAKKLFTIEFAVGWSTACLFAELFIRWTRQKVKSI